MCRQLSTLPRKVWSWWERCGVAHQHAKQGCTEAPGIGWDHSLTFMPLPDEARRLTWGDNPLSPYRCGAEEPEEGAVMSEKRDTPLVSMYWMPIICPAFSLCHFNNRSVKMLAFKKPNTFWISWNMHWEWWLMFTSVLDVKLWSNPVEGWFSRCKLL